jgi:hypothetical protein
MAVFVLPGTMPSECMQTGTSTPAETNGYDVLMLHSAWRRCTALPGSTHSASQKCRNALKEFTEGPRLSQE